MSGIIIVKFKRFNIFVRPFSVIDKTVSDVIAQEAYEDAFFDGVLTNDDMIKLATQNGWWSEEKEDKLKKSQEDLDQMKVDYYKKFFSETTRNFIKRSIDDQVKLINELHEEKNLFFDKTCESLKNYARTTYLLEKSSYVNNETLLDGEVSVYALLKRYFEGLLPDEKIRNVAKSNEWRVLWASSKNSSNLFVPSTHDLTGEQVSLISWSRFYDNVYESMECPRQEIIEDNIALDGWAIQQQREREKEQKQRDAEKMIPQSAGNANELFIPVRNQKEKEDILSLNNPEAKSILKSKHKQLTEEGRVKEKDLTHVKNTIQMQCNQLNSKGKR